jgi:transcriptional regulator GlxA family with amidase domain
MENLVLDGLAQAVHFIHTPSDADDRPLVAAARLLRAEPGRSILDVALGCGFSTSQYFATLFRRQFGCAPREYR